MFRDDPSTFKGTAQSPACKQSTHLNYPQTTLNNFQCNQESTIADGAKREKLRKNKIHEAFGPQRQRGMETQELNKTKTLMEDWKVLVVSGEDGCSLIKKLSRPAVNVPLRMEQLGDMNNSANERNELGSGEAPSTPTNERLDFFLQEISQFPSSQGSLSSYLSKRYKFEAPENETTYGEILKRIIKFLHKSWLNQTMCDAIISTDSGDILTHQVILATYSPTLESLLDQNRRALPQFVQINMNDYPKETITDVLNFLYTTNIRIDCKSIGSLVSVARQLDLPEIINICGIFLTKNYDHDNILLHYSVAANNLLRNSKNYLVKVIAMNFSLLIHHNHFLYIPIDRLVEILSHESLSGEELDILLSVIKWIDFNRSERMQFSKELFSHIRFELIDPEAIANQVEIHDWLFSDRSNKELISDAYKYHALVGTGECTKKTQRHQRTDANRDGCGDEGGAEKFPTCKRSQNVCGNTDTTKSWRTNQNNSTHQITSGREDFPLEVETEKEKTQFGGFEDPPERFSDIYQQQRKIQMTQLQLEKMQRQLLEQTLLPGPISQMQNATSDKQQPTSQ